MSVLEDQPQRLPEILAAVPLPDAPPLVLGLTGAPGVGKSTLADALVEACRARRPGRPVGVVAVDPTSPFTGGAVLGDRVRMMRHATDPLVFVRSMATRGHLGGLTLGVRGALRVMEILGCDPIVLETVGVGQSEVEVARVADLTVVVLAPGQGDGVQMLKAGLMEIGDLFAVTKADRPGAAELVATLRAMLAMAPAAAGAGLPEVFLVSGTERTGLAELIDGIERLGSRREVGRGERRAKGLRREIEESILEEARRRLLAGLPAEPEADGLVDRVLRGECGVADAASRLIADAAEESDG